MAGAGKTKTSAPSPRPFQGMAVEAAFSSFPEPVRERLLDIREIIFDVAETTSGVGTLQEALRWGQPSYLTSETGSGSTVRLGTLKSHDGAAVLFVHCQSGLAATFRDLYGSVLTIEGDRSLIFSAAAQLPEAELRHCIALALTHHLRRAKRKRG